MRQFGTVTIVGVGLIGGSIGLALRSRGLADRVIGLGRDRERLDEAKRLGTIDEGTTDLQDAVDQTDIVVVCTPTDRIAEDVRSIAAASRSGVMITDAGSTKRRIVEAVERDDRARHVFIGAHPLAGSERRGAEASRADLLEGRVCALTPTNRTPPELLSRAEAFWSGLGCRTVMLDPDAHDRALARTSHLPHVVASALALSIPSEHLSMAAGAYRDGTRVAASDPDLWVAIFLENPEHLQSALEDFQETLNRFRDALQRGDRDELRSLWSHAKALRGKFDPPPIH